jgi:hypothetical protein
MSKKAKTVSRKNKAERVMVLYGLGEDKKPRAAKFKEADFKLARKAAKLMGLSVHEMPEAALAKLGKPLPVGRIYASGSGFVPNVRRALYLDLLTLLGVKPEEARPERVLNLPANWDAIEKGHVVLAQADSAANGWWETTCEGVEGDMLKLRACLFPDITVSRHRTAVALLHTSAYRPPEASQDASPGLPKDWSELSVGQLVIAQENDAADGYWEALIDKIDGDTLTLHWRDFQSLPKFKRPRHAVALLNPVPPTQA